MNGSPAGAAAQNKKRDGTWEEMYRALLKGLFLFLLDKSSKRQKIKHLKVVVSAHVRNMAAYDGVPEEEWVFYRGWRKGELVE